MTAAKPEYQFPKADPQLRDLLDRHGTQVAQNLNCHVIAKVESFNKSKNTITASCSFKRQYSDGTIVEFPKFTDIPVITLCGGKSFLSMPIQQGDWCLLLFCDRDIDSWWYSGEVREPNSPRYHSLADGIALVGLKPATDCFELSTVCSLNGADKTVSLKNDRGELTMSAAGKAKIKNDTQSLKTILDSILTALASPTAGVDPGTHLFLPTIAIALNNAKSQLALLMED